MRWVISKRLLKTNNAILLSLFFYFYCIYYLLYYTFNIMNNNKNITSRDEYDNETKRDGKLPQLIEGE